MAATINNAATAHAGQILRNRRITKIKYVFVNVCVVRLSDPPRTTPLKTKNKLTAACPFRKKRVVEHAVVCQLCISRTANECQPATISAAMPRKDSNR